MDYERRYNSALERAKYALTTDMDNSGHWACTYIFPELKEMSEKEIIQYLIEECESIVANSDFVSQERETKAEKAIDWLKNRLSDDSARQEENRQIDYKNILGSIIYADSNGKLKATSKEWWNQSLGIPVAVVVIPASHMRDGKCRGMSLCNMSYMTPQTGTLGTGSTEAQAKINGTNLMWGVIDKDVKSLTNYDTVKTIGGTESYGYLPSDLFYMGYCPCATDNRKCVPPYSSYGTKNLAYLDAGQAFADMDGKKNTDALVNLSAIKDTYSSGAFENVQENYPAAFACHLFSTLGTEPGDWYLPALGELGYLYARIRTINESLAALGTSAVLFGDYTKNSYSFGDWCLSSSEYTTDGVWALHFNGFVSLTYKHESDGHGRVRAFAAFDI